MWRRWIVLLGVPILALGLCGGCLLSQFQKPRFRYEFDIGNGRTVTIWSIRRDILKEFLQYGELDTDPSPLMVYYRVHRDGRELTHTTYLEGDDEGDYQFDVLLAEGGQLACVYEVNRSKRSSYMVIMYDATSGESWPRDAHNWLHDAEMRQKWRKRFERIRQEHPDFPMPDGLQE